MYSISRIPATKEEYKEEKEQKTRTWIYDHEEISLDFTFDI